ncbi:MAG: hypothetical protein HY092_02890 [Candidatus Kerfeldbacteria bacterium]|nr:hypothetical protein [Candidatus Kerfeldbacteria bacterium]
MTGNVHDSLSLADVGALKNGSTFAEATATVTKDASNKTLGQKRTDKGTINVAFCEKPWQTTGPFVDTSTNCLSGSCNNFHFALSYCASSTTHACTAGICQDGKHQGSACGTSDDCNDLPYFSYHAIQGQTAASSDQLKGYFARGRPSMWG